ALAAQAHLAAGLAALGDADPRLAAVDGRHLDIAAQRRGRHAHRHATIEVGAVALEERVVAHFDEDVEIAGRPAAQACLALAREADAGAGLDARRNIDRERLFLLDPSGAVAGLAGVLDDL